MGGLRWADTNALSIGGFAPRAGPQQRRPSSAASADGRVGLVLAPLATGQRVGTPGPASLRCRHGQQPHAGQRGPGASCRSPWGNTWSQARPLRERGRRVGRSKGRAVPRPRQRHPGEATPSGERRRRCPGMNAGDRERGQQGEGLRKPGRTSGVRHRAVRRRPGSASCGGTPAEPDCAAPGKQRSRLPLPRANGAAGESGWDDGAVAPRAGPGDRT